MLDEVDKLGANFRGDPSSALMSVLDPEQNNSVAITTWMCRSIFPRYCPPRQTGWIPYRSHCVPMRSSNYPATRARRSCTSRHNIDCEASYRARLESRRTIEFTDAGLQEIIHSFTREAGVRNLEREIATITRKQARRYRRRQNRKDGRQHQKLFANSWRAQVRREKEQRNASSGWRCRGVVWTPVGGHHFHRGYADARAASSSP